MNPWKATPRETAPAVLVKACAHSLSQTTVAQLNHRWKQGEAYVPERWSDADVALLVKAHGRSTSPLDLRPIGVQDSLGKAVMSTTILRAKKAIHSLVSRFPTARLKNLLFILKGLQQSQPKERRNTAERLWLQSVPPPQAVLLHPGIDVAPDATSPASRRPHPNRLMVPCLDRAAIATLDAETKPDLTGSGQALQWHLPWLRTMRKPGASHGPSLKRPAGPLPDHTSSRMLPVPRCQQKLQGLLDVGQALASRFRPRLLPSRNSQD